MDSIREYVIGVVAAALISGAVLTLTDTKGSVGTAVKLLAGIMMLLAVIRPWASISIDSLLDWTRDIAVDGTDLVASGEKIADEAYREGIIQKTQAYILDEAKALDCEVSVEVILSDDALPERVTISGDISPYAKQVISAMLTNELGIEREDQIWT